MERNAFLPQVYHALDEYALLSEISQIDEVISRLPPDMEPLRLLRAEAEAARQTLSDELRQRDDLADQAES